MTEETIIENQERGFKGIWIPAEVWFDDRLTALDKIVLAEIDSLDTGEGCWASNEHLSTFCKCSVTKISTAISALKEFGYLEVVAFTGRSRKLKSSLSNFERLPFKNCKTDFQNLKESKIDEKHNEYNNLSLTREGARARVRAFQKPTIEEIDEYIKSHGYQVNAEVFYNYYESNGWKVGKNPMKDFRAALRTWQTREKESGKGKGNNRKLKESSFDTEDWFNAILRKSYNDMDIKL